MMRNGFWWRMTVAGWSLILLLAVMPLFPVAHSQERRRRRPSRRVTNPVRTPRPVPSAPAASTPDQSDASVISTADETIRREDPAPSSRRGQPRRRAEPETEEDILRRTVDRLSSQVTSLSEDLGQLKEQQRTLVDLERLSRAEQRAENLRAQLRDVLEKEAALQARAEQIEFDLQPDNIERRAALTGTLRPTELRDQIRRQLESERGRVRAQLDLFNTSRIRLEAGIAKADAEAERIRARIDATDRRPETGTNVTETPAPTPPPPQNDSQDSTPR